MAAPVLQFKRGLLANLPGLRVGEPGFTTDSYDLYVGLTSETSTNKFLGSHRYWTKNTATTGSGVNLVEGTDNGASFITLKAPDSLAGIVTYTLPGTDGTNNQVLATNGSGTLSFIDAVANLDIAGDSGTDTVDLLTDTLTFAGTTGEIETAVTNNQVQIGLPNNVTVGAALTVTGSLDVNGTDHDINGAIALDHVTVSAGATIGGTLDVNGDGHDIAGTISLDNVTISGITTITGSIDANGATHDIAGVVELDNINVATAATVATAIITNATITNTTFGSGTAITAVDTDLSAVSASDDTLASAKAIKAYVDSQVTAQDLDFAGDSGTGAVDLDSQTFTIAGTTGEIETSASGQTITIGLPNNVTVGAALTVTSRLDVNGDGHDIAGTIALDNVAVSGITTFTGAIDANGGATIDNIRIGVADNNEIDTSTGNLTIDSAGGTTTIDDELIVSGDVRINGNDLKASDGNTNITLTSNTLTEIKGDLQVTGNDIKDSAGNNVFTFDGSQNVTANNNLTVSGNLYVSGNTTQVNTASMTIEDRTIELGIVDGSAPVTATTWDLGVLFNYNSSGAKKSGVVWEQGTSRFVFGSQLTDGGGTDVNSPQISFSAYAPIEISALWINDCAGQSQVISCTGTERFLENITVDAGTF